jgi:tetratricopeptide (TPR) repeat protein
VTRTLGLAALLLVAVASVYAPVVGFDFLHTDDAKYVSGNPMVQAGLTGQGFRWAWTTTEASSYAPLTWLSLMLDVELFGPGPAGVHAVSALLHAVSVLLVFAALRALTGRTGPSAAVAGLFAVHPIHVESVAWVAQRKDVLSMAFGLAAVLSYTAWARRGGVLRYGATALCLALGLLAKPVLVTLPLLLLLLDYWPLGRLRVGGRTPRAGVAVPACAPRSPLALLAEKLPLLALSAVASVVTVHAQAGAMAPGQSVPLADRAANALVAYALYLGDAVWPSGLSIFYPHPGLPGGVPLSAADVLGAAALLLAVTLVVASRPRLPFLAVGWLWFLGAMVPMLGLVQVGAQARADRYAYLPFLGLYIAVVWAIDAALAARPRARPAAWALAAGAVGMLAFTAHGQVLLWRDTRTLFEHAYRVAPRAPFVLTTLGTAYLGEGRVDEALKAYRASLAVDPRDVTTRANLAVALTASGHPEEALREIEQAMILDPFRADLYLKAGKLFHAWGRLEEAALQYGRALEHAPDLAEAHLLRARALHALGRPEQAARDYAAAVEQAQRKLRLRGDAASHAELARLYLESGSWDAGLEHAARAARLAPQAPASLRVLAEALLAHPARGDVARAVSLAERAASLDPASLEVAATLVRAYERAGRPGDADRVGREALARAEANGPPELADWFRERLAGDRAAPGD